jgi:Plasma-membrane choline transporter
MSGFVLALKHSSTFMITNGIGFLVTNLGLISIAAGNTFVCYWILMFWYSKVIESYIPPLTVIFLMSLVLGHVQMHLYSITSLTLLQCLYTDVDICSQQRRSIVERSHRPREIEAVFDLLLKKETSHNNTSQNELV